MTERGFFVTATGTEIGKTYVTAHILRAAMAQGLAVTAVKPLMSGFAEDDLASSDAGQLLSAMGKPVTAAAIDAMVAHRFEAALAPNVAARQNDVELDFDRLVAFCRNRFDPKALNFVEGAGGLMSPVTDSHLHTHLIAALKLKVILVSGNYLGTVSHTLSALHVLADLGLEVAAIAVSQPTRTSGDPYEILPELARWSDIPAFAIGHGEKADALYAALRSA